MIRFSNYKVTIVLVIIIVGTLSGALLRRIDDTQTIRWAHVYEVGSPYHRQALWAADEFERRTRGRYRIRVYAASALGKEIAINESLKLGSIDIIYTATSLVGSEYPPMTFPDFPFAIDDYAHWQRFRDSDMFADIAAGYRSATGNTVLSLTYYGFRHVTSNKAITHPDDMRNLKIRVPNAPLFLIMPLATGANASPMPFSEVYLALQQGVVDAQENPLTTIRYKRFYEVQRHINLTGHMANSLISIASHQLLGKLGPADAELLREVLAQAAQRASDQIDRSEQELATWFRVQGLQVNEVDRAAFRELIEPILARPEYALDQTMFDRLRALSEPP